MCSRGRELLTFLPTFLGALNPDHPATQPGCIWPTSHTESPQD